MKRRQVVGALGALSTLSPSAAVLANAETLSIDRFDAVSRWANEHDQLHALVISRWGDVIFAEAFRGPNVSRSVNVKSVSKTMVALLTGIAIDKGLIPNTEAPLGSLIPNLIPRNADPRVSKITVADLLTMRAGLQRTSGPYYGSWVQSSDWISYALSRPMVAEPGTRFLYSTGSFHIMGAVLATVSGRSLLGLSREWLGKPLAIDIPPWTRDPQGFYMGGNNMALSPLALNRIGAMVLTGGVWNGHAVVPIDWLNDSWRARTRSPFSGHEYGYGWFLAHAGSYPVAYARGYGGQMLYVIADLGLSVAITSDPTRPARSQGYAGALNRFLTEEIIPASIG